MAQVACLVPLTVGAAIQDKPQQDLKCEDVYANIKAFKGVPAMDLIPSMEFMAASMKWECKDCHDTTDFSKETHNIETTRKMIELQRDINAKWFDGRLEVTCMTCHRGEEHPTNLPLPDGTVLRHGRMSNPPKPADLMAKHTAAVGKMPAMLTLNGTLTAPNDATHEVETKPIEFVQAEGGKFKIVSGDRNIVSDGTKVTYYGAELWGEPVFFFQRVGRSWLGEKAFDGLTGHAVAGKDKVGNKDVLVVRSSRASTGSQEELYFDLETGLLLKVVNMKRSSLGTVVTGYEYDQFKLVDGSLVPMRVTLTMAGGQQWVMEFKEAKTSATVDESLFKIGE